jgi:hypothetical protein
MLLKVLMKRAGRVVVVVMIKCGLLLYILHLVMVSVTIDTTASTSALNTATTAATSATMTAAITVISASAVKTERCYHYYWCYCLPISTVT